MKIIVLGSNGFFGNSIINNLKLNKKYKVYAVSRSKNIDLVNLKKFEKFINKIKPDVIINSAGYGGSVHYVAKHPAEILDINIKMYLNIYKATDNLKKKPVIINCLCNCVYTSHQKFQNEKTWDHGKVHDSVYTTGNIHRLRFLISRAWFEQHNVKSINLIFGGLFGPGDHLEDDRLHAFDGIIFRMIQALKKKSKTFKIYGSGKPIREWIYIDDAVKAIEIALKIKTPIINPLNVTNNYSISVNKIAKTAKQLIDFKGKLVNDLTYKDGDLIKRMSKQTKIYKKYFNKLKFTPINISILKTLKYYLKNVE